MTEETRTQETHRQICFLCIAEKDFSLRCEIGDFFPWVSVIGVLTHNFRSTRNVAKAFQIMVKLCIITRQNDIGIPSGKIVFHNCPQRSGS